MMKTTKTLLAALAIALVFGACSKEEAKFDEPRTFTTFDLKVVIPLKALSKKLITRT